MNRVPVVVIAGHVTHDRYGSETLAGGSAYYGAHTHRALGADIRLVTAVGDDFACPTALDGIVAQVQRGGVTTTFTNDYRGDLRVQRLDGLAAPVRAVDLPERWRRCDLLHLAPVIGEVDLSRWIQLGRARLVAIGVQGWIKQPGPHGTVVTRRWDVDARSLTGVDAACVGEEDLIEQGDLLDRLVEAVRVVAVTRGRRGCDLIVRGKTTRLGVHPASEVDPTGAGDVFAAGLFLGLARGLRPTEAARLGAAAASIVVEGCAGATLGRIGEAWERAPNVASGSPGTAGSDRPGSRSSTR